MTLKTRVKHPWIEKKSKRERKKERKERKNPTYFSLYVTWAQSTSLLKLKLVKTKKPIFRHHSTIHKNIYSKKKWINDAH